MKRCILFTESRPCVQDSVGKVLDGLGVRSENIGRYRRVDLLAVIVAMSY
jgi:hypothetical protein